MNLRARLESLLGDLKQPSASEMKTALISLKIKKEDLAEILPEDNGHPYTRTILYKNDEIELIAMKWSSEMDCAPHDHGGSAGWIQVAGGSSSHTIYKTGKNGMPVTHAVKIEPEGRVFYAPKRMIHKMGAAGSKRLITLHLYSPPITGMKVYDLEKCAACIVSEECGAWWPEEQRQIVKEIKMNLFS